MSPSTIHIFPVWSALQCNTSFLKTKKDTSKICQRLDTSILSLNLGFWISSLTPLTFDQPRRFILVSIHADFIFLLVFNFTLYCWCLLFYLTQGLILLACLALLAPSMAAPAPTFDPITAASFTAAGGLVCSFDILYMSSSNTIWFLRSWPPLPARPWPCQRRRSWLGRRWPSRDSCSRPSPTERGEWRKETGYMCNKRPLAY